MRTIAVHYDEAVCVETAGRHRTTPDAPEFKEGFFDYYLNGRSNPYVTRDGQVPPLDKQLAWRAGYTAAMICNERARGLYEGTAA